MKSSKIIEILETVWHFIALRNQVPCVNITLTLSDAGRNGCTPVRHQCVDNQDWIIVNVLRLRQRSEVDTLIDLLDVAARLHARDAGINVQNGSYVNARYIEVAGKFGLITGKRPNGATEVLDIEMSAWVEEKAMLKALRMQLA